MPSTTSSEHICAESAIPAFSQYEPSTRVYIPSPVKYSEMFPLIAPSKLFIQTSMRRWIRSFAEATSIILPFLSSSRLMYFAFSPKRIFTPSGS